MRRWLGGVEGQLDRVFSVRSWALILPTNTASIVASRNVASITDNGAGDITVTWAQAFSTASSYAPVVCSSGTSATATRQFQSFQAVTAASAQTAFYNWSAGAASDPGIVYIAALGEH